MRNPVRLVRRGIAINLHALPWTRRNFMMRCCDYRWVSLEKARQIQKAGWPGWPGPLTLLRRKWSDRWFMEEMHLAEPRGDFCAAASALDGTGLTSPSLLDVGCRGGLYSEIFKAMAKTRVDYAGVDPSSGNIEHARENYPTLAFTVGDPASLRFEDAAFDVVFNQVLSTRILDHEKIIAESVRVARKMVILQAVGVFDGRETAYLARYDHGASAVEIVFNRGALLASFARNGLQLVKSWHALDYDVRTLAMARYVQAWHWPTIAPLHSETFLCEKL